MAVNHRTIKTSDIQQTTNNLFIEAVKTRIYTKNEEEKTKCLERIAFSFEHGVIADLGMAASGFFSTTYYAATDPSSITCYPLHFAIENNDRPLATLLLNKGANPLLCNNAGVSSLELAVKKLNSDLVLMILKKLSSSSHNKALLLEHLNTIFSLCLSTHANINERSTIITELLKMGVNADTPIEGPHPFALHHAATTGDQKLVEILLAYKANPLLTDNAGVTALERAAKDHWDIILPILERAGKTINAETLGKLLWLTNAITDEDSQDIMVNAILLANPNASTSVIDNVKLVTFIEFFALEKKWTKVNKILDFFKNENNSDKVKLGRVLTIAMNANTRYSNIAAKTLLSLGVDTSVSMFGTSPLHIAAQRKDGALLAQLLQAHANPNMRDQTNRMAIEILAGIKAWELIPFFINTATVPLDRDSLGQVLWLAIDAHPLTAASTDAERLSFNQLIDPILRAGANVNRSVNGHPSLFLAIKQANSNLIKRLFYYGADSSKTNADSLTPLAFAKKLNGASVQAYIEGTTFLKNFHKARVAIMLFFSVAQHPEENILFRLPEDLRQSILNSAIGDLFEEFMTDQEKTYINAHRVLFADKKKLETRNSSTEIFVRMTKGNVIENSILAKATETQLKNAKELQDCPSFEEFELIPTAMKKLVVDANAIRKERIEKEQQKREAERLEAMRIEAAALNRTNGHAKNHRPHKNLPSIGGELVDMGEDATLMDDFDEMSETEKLGRETLANAFKLIYKAERAGQTVAGTNFLADKEELSAYLLLRKINLHKEESATNRTNFAISLAEKHKDNCTLDNVVLFWEIYKESFRHSPPTATSNILGSTYFFSSSLDRDTENLTEDQKAIIRKSIDEVDVNVENSRRANIVRVFKGQ